MKRCPACNKTFEEDWLSFCTDDGTTLVDDIFGSNEPPATIMAPAPPNVSVEQAPWNVPSSNATPSLPQWETPRAVTPGWQPPPPPAYAPNKSLATASMVIGIIGVTVGWLCLGPIPAIAAIILGAVALSQIKKNPERVGGKQAAWTGVITGGITVLLYGGVMIFYFIVMVVANS